MALTEEQKIYAEAADLIGDIEITENSDQNTKPYSSCVRHYPQAKNEIIRGYAWNEATELALSLEDATTPSHTYLFRFPLPSDCKRIIATTKPREPWRVLGNYIYTNYKWAPGEYETATEYKTGQYLSYSNITYLINTSFTSTSWASDSLNLISTGGDYGFIRVEYVKTLDNPADWSPQLRQAIILNLASKIVVPITGDPDRRTRLLEELYTLVLPHAQAIDAIQGKPKNFFDSDYIHSRQ